MGGSLSLAPVTAAQIWGKSCKGGREGGREGGCGEEKRGESGQWHAVGLKPLDFHVPSSLSSCHFSFPPFLPLHLIPQGAIVPRLLRNHQRCQEEAAPVRSVEGQVWEEEGRGRRRRKGKEEGKRERKILGSIGQWERRQDTRREGGREGGRGGGRGI